MGFSVRQEKVRVFQNNILEYYHESGRHELPWRQTQDPWKLLLAEMLLRKTTSDQANEIFLKLRNFSFHDILNIETDVLEEYLRPIGLYSVRASQIKAAAQAFSDASEEEMVSDQFLRSIPGVGRYIANMVRCCAYGSPLPGLDTNMIRVLQRVFGYVSERSRPREDPSFWEFAATLVPEHSPTEYNWGVLDLGAEICTFRKPKCSLCPLKEICIFYKENQQANSTR